MRGSCYSIYQLTALKVMVAQSPLRCLNTAWDTHKFDGDLLVVQKVGTLEDDAEGTLADLLAHPVMHANDV